MSEPVNMNPGSKAAIDAGCICAVLYNSHGDEELGKIHGFYITRGCPVHDKEVI